MPIDDNAPTDAAMPGEATIPGDLPAESSMAAPVALPEPARAEPPRPLVPGAFLRLEYEIGEVLSRGYTNLYKAYGGDFGDTVPKLVAERETSVSDEHRDAARGELQSPLFPPTDLFGQDGREYAVYEFEATAALQDHREPPHDERYLRMLETLSSGLLELESHGLYARLCRETLRVNTGGELRYFGFIDTRADAAGPDVAHDEPHALAQLGELNSYLLRTTFAQASTMRLDDEWGALALSDEVKQLARRLSEGECTTLEEAHHALAALARACAPGMVDIALLTDVGQERELNEDAGLVVRIQRAAHLRAHSFDLCAVADGMGGHEGGEVASNLALAALQQHLTEQSPPTWDDNVAVRQFLLQAIDAVNAQVVNLTNAPQYRGTRAKPGCTLVFAIRLGARVFVGNVGDSRAYKWNEAHGLQRITKDHSYVQTLIDQGEITDEEAWGHPDGSIITAHIGEAKLRLRDVFLRLLLPGDKLLLVSDGVVDMLRDSEIERIVATGNAAAVCRHLVDASNEAGGADNITAICLTA